ncbi:lipoyl synthase, partial [Cutibacterium acnes]
MGWGGGRGAPFPRGGPPPPRRCDFCQIESAKPEGYDKDEPRRVAESVKQMGLRYATVTSVCRDDLEDEGAWLCAETIRQIHQVTPGPGVGVLAQDFSGKQDP